MSLKTLDHREATDSESLSWKSEAFSLHSYHNILIPLWWTAASQGNAKGQTRMHAELLQRRPKQSGLDRWPQCLPLTHLEKALQDGSRMAWERLVLDPSAPLPFAHQSSCNKMADDMKKSSDHLPRTRPFPYPSHLIPLSLQSWPHCTEKKTDTMHKFCLFAQQETYRQSGSMVYDNTTRDLFPSLFCSARSSLLKLTR